MYLLVCLVELLLENSNQRFIFMLAQLYFALEGGKNWSSTLRSPKYVYDSHQISNIRREESGHNYNSFPKQISSLLTMC